MVFSIQNRFMLFLLVPVTLILIVVGVAGFVYARKHLREQWLISVQLKLEKAAHQISMKLDEKLRLIELISKAEHAPSREITQTFLLQQLAQQDGVRFVDLEPVEPSENEAPHRELDLDRSDNWIADGLYTMELCPEFGFCAPSMDPNSVDRSLRIIKVLGDPDDRTARRLTVRIRFDSFIEAVSAMGMEGSREACLVTSTGQFLTHTDKSVTDRKCLGDNGSDIEQQVLKQMRHNAFGTVLGPGHPPDLVIGFQKVSGVNWYVLLYSRGREAFEPIIEFRHHYSVAGLAAILLIVILIRVTTRSVGKAVADISAAAARVKTGDYSVKLPETRSDELGELNRSFNQLVEGLQRRDLIEQTFGRYVDKKIAEELMNKPEALRLGGEQRIVTIMMSDLRDFTGASEKLPPEIVIKMLNRYFARMIAVIEKYHGIIVDFFGDSILVFFNGIHSSVYEGAMDAVKCAMEMQQEHELFLVENAQLGLPLIQMGIGINTGEVVVGNIGTESRAKYGIVGSNVNLTDRIQGAAAAGKVVISERTYQAIWEKATVSHAFRVCLKGVENDKKLYEVESVEPE